MQIGKIPESLLKSIILGSLPEDREEILLSSGIGEDCAAVKVAADEILMLSTDPITGASKDAGRLAVIVTVNDLASSGAETIGLLITLLLPPECDEAVLKEIMKDVTSACKETNVSLIGGHTEVTDAVTRPLLSVTGIGKVKRERMIRTADVRPGMDIIATKWVGIEGTSIIAKEKEEDLLSHFPVHMIESAKSFDEYLSVQRDGLIAAEHGARAMHDVTEGGILGALWEMAEAGRCGVDVDLRLVPVRQETIEICEYYDINPYRLISSGCMLIAAEKSDEIQKALADAGISSTVIGRFTEGNDRIVRYDDRVRFLTPPVQDELYKAYLKRQGIS